MPAYTINFDIIIIPDVISYNLYFTHRHQTSYLCANVIRVTVVSMHNKEDSPIINGGSNYESL